MLSQRTSKPHPHLLLHHQDFKTRQAVRRLPNGSPHPSELSPDTFCKLGICVVSA